MLSVKNNFERRMGIWPAGFDKDDVMWCNTAFGDYPTLYPARNSSTWTMKMQSRMAGVGGFYRMDVIEL